MRVVSQERKMFPVALEDSSGDRIHLVAEIRDGGDIGEIKKNSGARPEVTDYFSRRTPPDVN